MYRIRATDHIDFAAIDDFCRRIKHSAIGAYGCHGVGQILYRLPGGKQTVAFTGRIQQGSGHCMHAVQPNTTPVAAAGAPLGRPGFPRARPG